MRPRRHAAPRRGPGAALRAARRARGDPPARPARPRRPAKGRERIPSRSAVASSTTIGTPAQVMSANRASAASRSPPRWTAIEREVGSGRYLNGGALGQREAGAHQRALQPLGPGAHVAEKQHSLSHERLRTSWTRNGHAWLQRNGMKTNDSVLTCRLREACRAPRPRRRHRRHGHSAVHQDAQSVAKNP